MSGPLKLNAEQLRNLGHALDDLTKIFKHHHVTVTPYAPVPLGIGDTTVQVTWDGEAEAYVVDDRVGS